MVPEAAGMVGHEALYEPMIEAISAALSLRGPSE
jgi:hypothetical protein